MIASNIIILGAGFIGTHLACALGNSHNIYIVGGSAACDLTHRDQMEQALQNCDSSTSIILTATVSRLRDNSYVGFSQNVLIAENLSLLLKVRRVRNVVFLSSVDVYGLLEESPTIHEDLPLRPDDYYAMSKVVSEFILTKSCGAQSIPLAIFRLTGVYGSGDTGKSTIWHLTQSAVKRGLISVYGDGQDERDFVPVQDVVKIIGFEIVAPRSHIINIASGRSLTILEIARRIAERIPCKIELVPIAVEENRPKRAKIMRFNIAKLKKEFPEFSPTFFSEGIQRYLSEYMSGG